MTLTIIDTDLITTETAFTFAYSGDQLVLTEGTLLASTEQNGIGDTFVNPPAVNISIYGSVVAAQYGIVGESSLVHIGTTGSITASDLFGIGIAMLGVESRVVNDGTIIAANGVGVFLKSLGSIVNRGQISGGGLRCSDSC